MYKENGLHVQRFFLLLFACLLDILILVFAWVNYKYIKKELPF